MLALVGDVVGMTGAHEATLAVEAGLPYAMLCMVDNMANGVGAGDKLTLTDFFASQKVRLPACLARPAPALTCPLLAARCRQRGARGELPAHLRGPQPGQGRAQHSPAAARGGGPVGSLCSRRRWHRPVHRGAFAGRHCL